MPLADKITLVGESVANPPGSATATLPSYVREYLSANTIGKLKACESKWTVKFSKVALAGGVVTPVAPENPARVMLWISYISSTDGFFFGGQDTTGPPMQQATGANVLLVDWDTYGPLVGQSVSIFTAFAGSASVIEVIANS